MNTLIHIEVCLWCSCEHDNYKLVKVKGTKSAEKLVIADAIMRTLTFQKCRICKCGITLRVPFSFQANEVISMITVKDPIQFHD